MRASRIAAIAIVAAAIAVPAGAASAQAVTPVPFRGFAFPVSATALTVISNDPDNGHGTPSRWATDTIWRLVTVTRGAKVPGTDCGLSSGACYAYTMSLRDEGSFVTIPGAGTPNQACAGCAGKHIARKVSGSLDGWYSVTFDASSGSPSAARVPMMHNDHGTAASPPFTSTTWGELFFPAGTSFGNVDGGAYSWTYTVPFPREQWRDGSDNNDGSTTGPGNNITG